MLDMNGRIGNWRMQPVKRAPRLFERLGNEQSKPDANCSIEQYAGWIRDGKLVSGSGPSFTGQQGVAGELSKSGDSAILGPQGQEGKSKPELIHINGRLCLYGFFSERDNTLRGHVLVTSPSGSLRITDISESPIPKYDREDLHHVGLVYIDVSDCSINVLLHSDGISLTRLRFGELLKVAREKAEKTFAAQGHL